jgi:hypothetical protein
MAVALDMSLRLDITENDDLWNFLHNDHGVSVALRQDVIDWAEEHLGPHQLDMLYKVTPTIYLKTSGMTNYYTVHIRFLEEAKMVHFRLRWGGRPVV